MHEALTQRSWVRNPIVALNFGGLNLQLLQFGLPLGRRVSSFNLYQKNFLPLFTSSSLKSIVGTILPTVTRYFFQCSTPCGAGFRQRKVKCIMIDEDGITKDLSDEHCAMLQKPPEKEKCDASRICLTPGIQRHKPLRIKKSLKYRRNSSYGHLY